MPDLPESERACATHQPLTPCNPFSMFPTTALEQTLSSRFRQQVELYPEHIVVQSRQGTVTYAALQDMANGLAQVILEQKAEEGRIVALLLDQGIPAIAAMLGALQAGKPFVMLDPALPQARLAYMLSDSQAAMMVTTTAHQALAYSLATSKMPILASDTVEARRETTSPGVRVSPDDLACLLYTSGSTGQPKGVMHTHRTLMHGVLRRTNNFYISATDHLTLFASGTTQALMNILSTILNGATLHPLSIKSEGVNLLAAWLRQEGITIYHSAAPLFRQFIQTLTGQETFPQLRLVRLASDMVYPSDVALFQQHFGPGCLLANGVSSTETGTHCLYFMDHSTTLASRIVPVGYALEDMEILILNAEGVDIGPDGVGEIAVRSPYLSPGYWRQPELTRDLFMADPAGSDKKVYRTRDVGRLRADGCLEYLGRQGPRVQVRGYRVEIAEVEAALRSLDMVHDAVVIAQEQQEQIGQTQLLAYVVPAHTPAPPQAALRHALSATLPDYMLPSAFVMLEALPMTPNGKIDRRALPALDAQRLELGSPYAAPRTATEAAVVRLWSRMLNAEQIGIHDDFFALGGHSLLAMQLLTRVRELFHVDIPLAALIAAPTVAALAQAIANPDGQRLAPQLLPYKPYGSRRPFFCVHGVELLARHMDADQPFYALHPHGLDGARAPRTVEAMAADYVQAIQTCQPQGPYVLGGYSFGGLIAWEMARQLCQQGQQVAMLILLDSGGPNEGRSAQGSWLSHARDASRVLLAYACDLYLRAGRYLPLWLRLPYFLGVSRRASQAYTPLLYSGRVKLLRAQDNPRDPQQRWGGMLPDGLETIDVPGDHHSMLTEPHVQQVVMQLGKILRQVS